MIVRPRPSGFKLFLLWRGSILPRIAMPLLVNVLASFCAGMAAAGYAYHTVDHATSLIFVAGFLGGMSTFSAAINEMVSLARNRRWWLAFWYLLATIAAPLLCAALGWMLVAVTR